MSEVLSRRTLRDVSHEWWKDKPHLLDTSKLQAQHIRAPSTSYLQTSTKHTTQNTQQWRTSSATTGTSPIAGAEPLRPGTWNSATDARTAAVALRRGWMKTRNDLARNPAHARAHISPVFGVAYLMVKQGCELELVSISSLAP
ncbi:hypothetical protein B0T17DRAFT_509790 [Bombardia bombarda]|uniref:Uncharacterized protein n=1 Tax=Bombardia bombarda TaxID=252184 RepID=A0AA39WMT1_9PEZI|nr:hypothetical protein B0T17DRAFT_509790 [Bombardia bombarda]